MYTLCNQKKKPRLTLFYGSGLVNMLRNISTKSYWICTMLVQVTVDGEVGKPSHWQAGHILVLTVSVHQLQFGHGYVSCCSAVRRNCMAQKEVRQVSTRILSSWRNMGFAHDIWQMLVIVKFFICYTVIDLSMGYFIFGWEQSVNFFGVKPKLGLRPYLSEK